MITPGEWTAAQVRAHHYADLVAGKGSKGFKAIGEQLYQEGPAVIGYTLMLLENNIYRMATRANDQERSLQEQHQQIQEMGRLKTRIAMVGTVVGTVVDAYLKEDK